MSGKWEDKGSAEGLLGDAIGGLFGVHEHLVQNTETGQTRTVYVGKDETVGEAISNGQFKNEE